MRKIVILSLILILILSAFYNCCAFEIGKKDIVSIGTCETYFKYKGKPNHVEFVIYENNGKQYPAYCLNPELNGIGTGGVGNYSVNVYEKLKNVNAWRAIVNGFPYKTLAELGVQSKEEAFTATKAAVYTMMFNRNTNDYEPLDSEGAQRAYNAYLKIVNDARNCIEPFEENIQISISADTDYWMVDNKNNLEFAKYLNNINIPIWIRQVLVPGYTDDKFDLQKLKAFINSLSNVEKVEILPYHNLGKFKWDELGDKYELENVVPPSQEDIIRAEQILGI